MLKEIILFNNQQKGKGRPLDLAHITKVFERTHLKILTPKQTLHRLPTALSQVKAGSTSENLLN